MHTDPEGTREVQQKRIECCNKERRSAFHGRQKRSRDNEARVKMSENKVNGLEDAVASEMIRQLHLEKIYTLTKCFQERFTG